MIKNYLKIKICIYNTYNMLSKEFKTEFYKIYGRAPWECKYCSIIIRDSNINLHKNTKIHHLKKEIYTLKKELRRIKPSSKEKEKDK